MGLLLGCLRCLPYVACVADLGDLVIHGAWVWAWSGELLRMPHDAVWRGVLRGCRLPFGWRRLLVFGSVRSYCLLPSPAHEYPNNWSMHTLNVVLLIRPLHCQHALVVCGAD